MYTCSCVKYNRAIKCNKLNIGYLYVCDYLSTHIRMHAHTCAYTHKCTHVHTQMRTHVRTYGCTHTNILTRAHMYTYLHNH